MRGFRPVKTKTGWPKRTHVRDLQGRRVQFPGATRLHTSVNTSVGSGSLHHSDAETMSPGTLLREQESALQGWFSCQLVECFPGMQSIGEKIVN